MKKNRIQVILPDTAMEKFQKQMAKHGRSSSNLGRKYIIEGLNRDEEKEKK